MAQQIRLQNNALARWYHNDLYERMVKFCQQTTPEFPADPIVSTWLSRLYSGDSSIHILIRVNEDMKIVGHAVIDVQNTYGYKVVFCHQCQGDLAKLADIDEGAEYIDKLCVQEQAVCAIFFVQKHSAALQKRYGYKMSRVAMIKQCGTDEDFDTDDC